MKSLLAFALVGLATASPLQAAPASLDKRSSEGVYLSNCNEFEPGILFSEMDYYSNAKSGSQNQEHPQATAYVSSGYIHWEGQQVCGTFSSSGETFCSNIDSGAQSYVSISFIWCRGKGSFDDVWIENYGLT